MSTSFYNVECLLVQRSNVHLYLYLINIIIIITIFIYLFYIITEFKLWGFNALPEL